MNSDRILAGTIRQGDVPNWTSLENLLGFDLLCGHFMWMFDVELEDGTILDAYKHRWTRCYFHLASDGRAFYFTANGRYCEVDPHRAIVGVFKDWACCEPTEAEEAALEDALSRARRTRNNADHI
jgi:hypothetical protein